MPTLILHARGDLRRPVRPRLVELGTLIRGSRVVPRDSANHLLRADEPAWAQLLAEIDAFLAADGAELRPSAVAVSEPRARRWG